MKYPALMTLNDGIPELLELRSILEGSFNRLENNRPSQLLVIRQIDIRKVHIPIEATILTQIKKVSKNQLL